MTTLYSGSEKTAKLNARISNLLDFKLKVKITKLENGTVRVNNYLINNVRGHWQCNNLKFFRRKSAVGYALCLIDKNYNLANKIQELDARLQKYKIDIDIYYYHLRLGKRTTSDVMQNRISSDMPHLYDADNKLTQLLKTIQI